MKQQDRSKMNQAMRYAGIGTEMLVGLGLGVWGGIVLDEKWNCSPLLLIVLPVLALSISLYRLYKQLVNRK